MSVSDQELLQTMREIGRLLFRRLKGDLSETQQIELDQWMIRQDPLSREFFENCTDYDEVYAALAVMYQFDQDAAFLDLQKKIDFGIKPDLPFEKQPGRIYRWRVYLIAASILTISIGVSMFFVLNNKKIDISRLPIAKRLKNDVSPGGNKATLKLGDGKIITLDNASNGELAIQGNTKIIKLDDGQVAYHVSASESSLTTYNTISTPKGGQYQVVLPDGSKVWLNAASSLKFPTVFSGSERIVELSGEGYFYVAKNASKPFKVNVTQTSNNARPLQVEVLGTEFDVMAYNDEDNQNVTLVNGAVKANTLNKQILLDPGQRAEVKKSSNSLNRTAEINVEEIIAWKNGLFQFQDASIESIMRQVARWYDIDVEYKGKIEQLFVGKIDRKVNISTLLKILEATGWVHFTVEVKKVTVYP